MDASDFVPEEFRAIIYKAGPVEFPCGCVVRVARRQITDVVRPCATLTNEVNRACDNCSSPEDAIDMHLCCNVSVGRMDDWQEYRRRC